MAGAAIVVTRQLGIGGLLRVRLVHVLVVAEMLRGLDRRLMLAIRRRSAPGELERQQQREEQRDEPVRAQTIAGRL